MAGRRNEIEGSSGKKLMVGSQRNKPEVKSSKQRIGGSLGIIFSALNYVSMFICPKSRDFVLLFLVLYFRIS